MDISAPASPARSHHGDHHLQQPAGEKGKAKLSDAEVAAIIKDLDDHHLKDLRKMRIYRHPITQHFYQLTAAEANNIGGFMNWREDSQPNEHQRVSIEQLIEYKKSFAHRAA